MGNGRIARRMAADYGIFGGISFFMTKCVFCFVKHPIDVKTAQCMACFICFVFFTSFLFSFLILERENDNTSQREGHLRSVVFVVPLHWNGEQLVSRVPLPLPGSSGMLQYLWSTQCSESFPHL
jgi:hypothetical protein